MKFLKSQLDDLTNKGLIRSLVNQGDLIDFSSNDYLGLARSTLFHDRFLELAEKTSRSGSSGSRLLTGNNPEIDQLEQKISKFHDVDSALVFPTGYQANLGLLSTVAHKGDTLILDELCHASLIDSARLSFAQRLKFKHNDLSHLQTRLAQANGEKFVVVESLYSMNGGLSDLKAIHQLCDQYDAHLIVDEAHSVGVYGEYGQGLLNELGLEKTIFARIVTHGKAFGYQGGAILGSSILKQFLINKSRSFIYSTGISLHQVLGLSVAYDLVRESGNQRSLLKSNVTFFKQCIQESNLPHIQSDSQIQAIQIDDNDRVLMLSEKLRSNGILALSIRSPTVAIGSERIRICLHAYNSREEIRKLVNTLKP